MNITVIRVSGTLDIGIVGCRGLLPDLWRLAGDISEALNDLLQKVPARHEADAVAPQPGARRRSPAGRLPR